MRLRPETWFVVALLGLQLLGGCTAALTCILLGAGDTELDSFAVTSPDSGDAFDGPIDFTFSYATNDDSLVAVELYVDGVLVAEGSADDGVTWTPAHDSGDLDLTIRGYAVMRTGQQAFVPLSLDWTAPWQAAIRQCVALSCDVITDVTLGEAPTRLLGRADFDVARTAEVVYAIDDVEVATRTEPPFWIDLDATAAAPGTHTLTATIRRDDDATATATATIVVP